MQKQDGYHGNEGRLLMHTDGNCYMNLKNYQIKVGILHLFVKFKCNIFIKYMGMCVNITRILQMLGYLMCRFIWKISIQKSPLRCIWDIYT